MSYFDTVPLKKPKRSVFDLSYENKLTCNMADLVPILRYDVVPGDTFDCNSEVFLRFAPLLSPVMHRIDVFVHYFFVPYRLIWDDWKDFITGGVSGTDEPVFPRIPLGSFMGANGSLADYLGINVPSNLGNQPPEVSVLPFRAYQLIFNEYYRDQNLQNEVFFSKASGTMSHGLNGKDDVLCAGSDASVTSNLYALQLLNSLQKRCWEKDYFTSCLPYPQRGLEAIVPVKFENSGTMYTNRTPLTRAYQRTSDSGQLSENATLEAWPYNAGAGNIFPEGVTHTNSNNFQIGSTDEGTHLEGHRHQIDLAQLFTNISASGVTVNAIRIANSVQRFLERMNIGGSRYVEQILSMFGVHVPDFTLQRPQYLGGGKQPVVISEVLQTSQTDTTPQGNMAGHGYAVGAKNRFKHYFDEHGIVLGLMSVRPRTNYQQGLDRMYTKFDKFDYYWPQFAHLGEQEVLKKELFVTGLSASDDATFGYQERYAEYKYRSSEVHGDFKDSLDYWHLGRKFSSLPSLNSDFVKCNPSDRVFAVESADVNKLYVQVYNNCTAVRPIPKHVTPSL